MSNGKKNQNKQKKKQWKDLKVWMVNGEVPDVDVDAHRNQ